MSKRKYRQHGMSKTKLYKKWAVMRYRCSNPRYVRFKDYGGRGIRVCKRWGSFENFLRDMGRPPSDSYTLERINNSKGYCKRNCRWATRLAQMGNTRKNHFLSYKGQKLHLAEWARRIKIGRRTLLNRLERGWDAEKCLTTPLQVQRH